MILEPTENEWAVVIVARVNGTATISPVGGPPAELVKAIVELLRRGQNP